MSPILNSTKQQLIANMYTKFEDSSFNSSWENCNKFSNLTGKVGKERKMDRKEEYKQWAWVSIPWYNYSFSICMACLKTVARIVNEKTVTNIYLEKTEKYTN